MWQQKTTLEELNIELLPISFEYIEKPALPLNDTDRSMYYYLDPEREYYHYFGMYSAGFWDVWGPKSLFTYIKLLVKGEKLQESGSDINQRGGDILIDPDGFIRLHHVGAGPGDRPSAEQIFELVRSFQK